MKAYIKYAVLIGVILAGIGFYVYNKPHQNIQRASSNFQIEAPNLFTEFETDEANANEKYLDKIVEVSGVVIESSTDDKGKTSVTLDAGSMFGVICQLDELSKHKRTDFPVGEKVTLKGVCTGMLMDVVLVRCVEVQ